MDGWSVRQVCCLLLLLLLMTLLSWMRVPPVYAELHVTTEPATEITHTEATLNGYTPENLDECSFSEGLGKIGGEFGASLYTSCTGGPFSIRYSHLEPGETYRYSACPRPFCISTSFPDGWTFTTTIPYPPLASTQAATDITSDSALIRGISHRGEGPGAPASDQNDDASACSFSVEASTGQSVIPPPCSAAVSCPPETSEGIKCYAVTVEHLAPDTVYSFAFNAENAGGASTGARLTFTTLAGSPAGGGTGGESSSTDSTGGSGSGLGSTAAIISTAEVAALLAGQLTPSRKAAKIAALLRSGGFALVFKALEAGTAMIGWYQVPRGAKLAKKTTPKLVLVAAGHLTFPAAGTAMIRVKLTAAGKRLLKHAKSLKLTAKGTFTPAGKTPISITKVFVVKH